MPMRPPRVCQCGKVVPSGQRCQCQVAKDKARNAAYDRSRPTAAARGYDHDWRRLRTAFLADNPVCSEPDCEAQSTDADHVLSVKQRPDLRLDRRNLRAFCHRHHSRRTAREQGFARPKDRQ